MRPLLILAAGLSCWFTCASAQIRLVDESDRTAFRAWFLLLADAQFYRPTPDVTDCSGLVRHAVREALRPHTAEWLRRYALPSMPIYPDVRRPPRPRDGAWPLFRVSDDRFAEFADARTIVRYNADARGRSLADTRPGDLLYFHQASGSTPDHLMVVVGRSAFDRSATDWIVYHTGPDGASAGEVRKVRLADLVRHPSPRWRPVPENPIFVGVFRLALL
ncbi:MAG TPA: DUF1175 family protein [Vicinamibacterales bacterium]|jgi:hypothetical protein